MSVPRYGSYRDSGVEWLGEVPSHWAVPKLKQLATFIGGGTPSRDKPELWNGEIPWVSPKDMKSEALSDSEERLTDLGLAVSAANLVRPGAVLMVVRSGILRHTIPVAVNLASVALNQDMKAIVFESKQCLPWFFLRWVQGFNTALINAVCKQGATVESIEHDYLREVQFPLPPLPEQAAIAAFLDRETAKIDALVEEQRRLIALLAEKRQAVISHAVTKGLDPTVPMKDSGVEGLGEVPAHWEVKRLKHLGCFSAGAGFPDREQGLEGEALSFHKVNALGKAGPDGYLLPSENTISIETALRLRAFVFPPDAIVFAKIGAALLLGRLRMLRVPACLDNNMMGFVVQSPNKFRYIRYLMSQIRFDLIANPGAVPSLNESQIANLAFAIPCSVEQEKITIYLDNEIFRSDALTAEAQAAITLLQERRAALISAAVTGKIDVRGLGPAVEEAA
ncbi:MAG: hypothetical protein B7Y95_19235 [Rhizobiales bacterium 32-66-11]|nr:MAG: hypothetical protein B7Y95_19235 [Rhizobiales bacterium 32-66-11]